MDDSSSRDLKKRLCILEDENGLELSLGLGLSCGGGSYSASEKKSAAPDGAEDDRIARLNSNSSGNQGIHSRRKPVEAHLNGSMQQQLQQQQHRSLREFFAPDVAARQQIAAAPPWEVQMNKHLNDPSSKNLQLGGIPMSEIAKFLAAGKSSVLGHQTVASQPGEDDEELESAEQQKKFAQHQEARKKRKMLIDEQKKKSKDDDKPDPDLISGLPPIHRVSSLGAFPSRSSDPAALNPMAVLTSQLMNMRRTISDPSLAQALSKDETSSAANAQEVGDQAAARGSIENGSNNSSSSSEQLLGMWQLGTTVDVPSAESLNPELSSVRPGTVSSAQQIGGSGSSPDLPWVSANAPGGKSITGVAYKMLQGQFKIVCSCHGLHMSPGEFVKHAAGDGGGKGIGGGDAVSMMSQVTPA